MTRIFNDGAELRDLYAWSSYNSVTVSTTTYRSGTASYQFANNYWAQYNISSASQIYVRLGLYFDNDTPNGLILKFRKDTTVLDTLNLHPDGSRILRVYSGDMSTILATGTNALLKNTWNLIETRIVIDDNPNGIFTVKLNGIQEIAYTGDTKPGSDTQMDNILFWGLYGTNSYMDDIAINDTNGSVDNSWCGDGRYAKISPDSAGSLNEWLNSGSAASSNNYTYVDEYPKDDDTTYVYCSGSNTGLKDKYNMTSLSTGGGNIKRIYSEGRARQTTAGSASLTIGYLPNAGTDQLTTASYVSSVYTRVISTSASANPVTGIAWTEADLNALQFVVGIP